MSSKKSVASLGSFVASKVNAVPAPLHTEPPPAMPANDQTAPRKAAQPKPASVVKEPTDAKLKVPEQLVTLNLSVAKSFRRELKQYALDLDTSMAAIVKEAVELHRQKHDAK